MRIIFRDENGKLVAVEATRVTWDAEHAIIMIQDGDACGSWLFAELTESYYEAIVQQLVKQGYTEMLLADKVIGVWLAKEHIEMLLANMVYGAGVDANTNDRVGSLKHFGE